MKFQGYWKAIPVVAWCVRNCVFFWFPRPWWSVLDNSKVLKVERRKMCKIGREGARGRWWCKQCKHIIRCGKTIVCGRIIEKCENTLVLYAKNYLGLLYTGWSRKNATAYFCYLQMQTVVAIWCRIFLGTKWDQERPNRCSSFDFGVQFVMQSQCCNPAELALDLLRCDDRSGVLLWFIFDIFIFL